MYKFFLIIFLAFFFLALFPIKQAYAQINCFTVSVVPSSSNPTLPSPGQWIYATVIVKNSVDCDAVGQGYTIDIGWSLSQGSGTDSFFGPSTDSYTLSANIPPGLTAQHIFGTQVKIGNYCSTSGHVQITGTFSKGSESTPLAKQVTTLDHGVGARLTGAVTDQNGNGVNGARVTINPADYSSGSYTTNTSDGFFVFNGLDCSSTIPSHTITATSNGQSSQRTVYYSSSPNTPRLCNGSTIDIPLQLQPAGPTSTPTSTPTNTPTPTITPFISPPPPPPTLSCTVNGVLLLTAQWYGNSNTTGCNIWVQGGSSAYQISKACNGGSQNMNFLHDNRGVSPDTSLQSGNIFELHAWDNNNPERISAQTTCPGAATCTFDPPSPACNGTDSQITWTIKNLASANCSTLTLHDDTLSSVVSNPGCASSYTNSSLIPGHNYSLQVIGSPSGCISSSITAPACTTPTSTPTGTLSPSPTPTVTVTPSATPGACPNGTTYTISGTVLKNTGGYQDGVRVCIDPPSGGCPDNTPKTGTNGSFTIGGVRPGPGNPEHNVYLDTRDLPSNVTVDTNPVPIPGSICQNQSFNFYVNYPTNANPTATATLSPTPGVVCDPSANQSCTTGLASGCKWVTNNFNDPIHQYCENISNPINVNRNCQYCPPPTPPKQCQLIDPPNDGPTVTAEAPPNQSILDITYTYGDGLLSDNNGSIPIIYGNIYHSHQLGFIQSGGSGIGTQYSNFGYSWDGSPGSLQTIYYQAMATNGNQVAYSNTFGINSMKANNDWHQGTSSNPPSIVEATFDSKNTTSTSLAFYLSIVSGPGPWQWYGCGDCTPSYTPPFIKIQRATTGYLPGYLPWNSQYVSRACLWYNGQWPYYCEKMRYTYPYSISLPPGTTDTFTITGFNDGSYPQENTAYGSAKIQNGRSTLVGTLNKDPAPTPVTPFIGLHANPRIDSTGRPYDVVLFPAQNGQVINVSKASGIGSRWTGTPVSTTRSRTPNSNSWTYTGKEDLENFPGGWYYYGLTLDLYPIVGNCDSRNVQTGQSKGTYWPGYSVSGNVFVDLNKNDLKDSPPEVNYTDQPPIKIIATGGGGVIETTTKPDGSYTLPELAGGTTEYKIKITNLSDTPYDGIYPLGGTYTKVKLGKTNCATYPNNFSPNATSTDPSAPNPAVCEKDSNGKLTGNMTNLNFALRKQPWFQGIGGDMRKDGGFTDRLPKNIPPAPTYFASLLGNATLQSNKTPGIIYGGEGTLPDFGYGQSSTTGWVVTGAGSKFSPASNAGIRTSYKYIDGRVNDNKITKIPLTDVCSDLSNCSLPTNLENRVYSAGTDTEPANVTLNTYTFPTGKNFILLIKGNLKINGDINVPNGSTLMVAVGSSPIVTATGNITISKDIGQTVTPNTTPLPCVPSTTQRGTSTNANSICNIEGFYSADGTILLEGNNGKCVIPPSTTINRDKYLTIAGALITNAKLQGGGVLNNQRDLCDVNFTTPSYVVVERPDLIVNLPDLLKIPTFKWQEIAP